MLISSFSGWTIAAPMYHSPSNKARMFPATSLTQTQMIRAAATNSPRTFEPTYVAYPPERTIDYIFGPAQWTLEEEKILVNELSDHYAVMAILRAGQKY